MSTGDYPTPESRCVATCRICGLRDGMECWSAQEMMFGTRNRFEYLRCGGCGAMQIGEVPRELGAYYPDAYYSFVPPARRAWWIRRLQRLRARYRSTGRGGLGWLLDRVTRYGHGPAMDAVRRTGVPRDARILDVGCGQGGLLRELASAGFRDLTGVDPFVEPLEEDALRILRGTVADAPGRYDLVLLNHVIEHVEDQHGTMASVRERMAPGGWCVVRTPVMGTEAWRRFGTEWVQLDPPRHLVVHSPRSLRELAASHGLRLVETVFDSSDFQFTGSIGYRRGVPLVEQEELFSRRERRRYAREARRLNRRGDGDQAAFYFRVA